MGKRPAKKSAKKSAAKKSAAPAGAASTSKTPFCDLLLKMAKSPATSRAVFKKAADVLVKEHGITHVQAFALMSGDGQRMETHVRLEAVSAGVSAASGPTPLHTIGPPGGTGGG